MKHTYKMTVLIVALVALAIAAPLAMSASQQTAPVRAPDDWFWGPTITVAQAFSGQFDDQIVVVEGQVGNQVDPIPWNIFLFSDNTATIRANFEDNVPGAAIPRNSTVRLIGEIDQGELDVEGLQTMGTVPVQPDATAAQINNGWYDGQNVIAQGMIGDLVYEPWNLFEFSDSTGTTKVDLQNDLTLQQIPRDRTIMVFGDVDVDAGQRKIDTGLMLLQGSGGQPTATPTATSVPPTATPTATPQGPTATPTATIPPNLVRKF
ncbi:MAG: NirD/YgiW/YdeI family stress tolerance protein, partial [Caldilineaceae bacterium]|nr:NirD/YgiW/YdeI family stress tolerance protein [Caldilineaceae bacterium]